MVKSDLAICKRDISASTISTICRIFMADEYTGLHWPHGIDLSQAFARLDFAHRFRWASAIFSLASALNFLPVDCGLPNSEFPLRSAFASSSRAISSSIARTSLLVSIVDLPLFEDAKDVSQIILSLKRDLLRFYVAGLLFPKKEARREVCLRASEVSTWVEPLERRLRASEGFIFRLSPGRKAARLSGSVIPQASAAGECCRSKKNRARDRYHHAPKMSLVPFYSLRCGTKVRDGIAAILLSAEVCDVPTEQA